MQVLRKLFPVKCEECGQNIVGDGRPGLGPGSMCEVCHKKLEEERERGYQKANRKTAQQVVDCVHRDFPPEDVDEVFTILGRYGRVAIQRSGREFMWLAILRLANGDKQRLPELVGMANSDFREIMAPVLEQYGPEWFDSYVGRGEGRKGGLENDE